MYNISYLKVYIILLLIKKNNTIQQYYNLNDVQFCDNYEYIGLNNFIETWSLFIFLYNRFVIIINNWVSAGLVVYIKNLNSNSNKSINTITLMDEAYHLPIGFF